MMGGWKTWVAGIGTILTGLGLIAAGVTADIIDMELIVSGAKTVLAGLAVLGIGHKIEKAAK
jgi:hypothetical protein